MNLKEKSIQYWENKLKEFEPKKGVTIMTTPERQKQFLEEYQENLDFVKSKPLSWFEKFEKLANTQTTYALCGGHTKAAMNKSARNKIENELNCDVPTDKLLYSFGTFNGIGAV
jgi:hypothetical protein